MLILGSTGSIGTQALEVISASPELRVVGLAAGRSWETTVAQAREQVIGVELIVAAASGQQGRGCPVDPARSSHWRLRDQELSGQSGDNCQNHRDPEQPVVVERIDNRPRKDNAKSATDSRLNDPDLPKMRTAGRLFVLKNRFSDQAAKLAELLV